MKPLARIGLFVILAAWVAWVPVFLGSTWDLVFLAIAALGILLAATVWTPLGLLVHGLAWLWFPIELANAGADLWTEVVVATVATACLIATAILLMGRKLAAAGWFLVVAGLVQGVWIVTNLMADEGQFVPGNALFSAGCLVTGLAWVAERVWTESSFAGTSS